MTGTRRWLITIGAALLAFAVCVAAVWLVGVGDLATRVAIGSSAGVVVGAVVALWGAAASERDAGPDRVSFAVRSRGDVHFGNSVISVGNQPAEPGTVTAAMTAAHAVPPEGGWTLRGGSRPEGRMVGDRLVIRPAHPYLDLLESGAEFEPSESGFFYWPLMSSPAQLDIRLVNNTRGTVVAHLVRLDVRRSIDHVHSIPGTDGGRVVLDPWPRVKDPIEFSPDRHRAADGSDGDGATLRFHLEVPETARALTAEHVWADYWYGQSGYSGATAAAYGPQNADHPLIHALSEAGARPVQDQERARLRYESLRESGVIPADNPLPPGVRPFHDYTWDMGPFGDGRAMMVGVVSYAETGVDQAETTYSYRFRTPIDLKVGYPRARGPARIEGLVLHPSATYPGPMLRGSGEDYTVEIPISQWLAAGRADRFLISLEAGVPSTHDFHVTVLCNAGAVDCGPVLLETMRTIDRKYLV